MGLKERVEEEIVRLNPRLMELAQGEVALISIDEETATVTVRVFRGILIANGINACSLWADQLLKKAIPEIRDVRCIWGPLPNDNCDTSD
ncbi:MAG: hypothetical protein PHT96_00920 [Syntrophorhabdaceae bacterium]|nr:hypothetical protein [Syntrophorhabdaceae bacterium]MDD4194957.1 hypothetical protein [Syntrophorhabdaceae bacterium]